MKNNIRIILKEQIKGKGLHIIFVILFAILTLVSKSQKNNTFCFGNIKLTLVDGGTALQSLYNTSGNLIKSISGNWVAYGSKTDMPGQTIKITFNVSTKTFSYVLIRDGFGKPSVLIDETGRQYNICSQNSNNNKRLYDDEIKFPDMSSLQDIQIPKVSVLSSYKLKKESNDYYVVLDKKKNTPLFYLSPVEVIKDESIYKQGYYDAKKLCSETIISGMKDWRLPTFEELNIIYSLKSQIVPHPRDLMYWSNTNSEKDPEAGVKCIDFSNGEIIEGLRENGYIPARGYSRLGYTFAVRDINPSKETESQFVKIQSQTNKTLMVLFTDSINEITNKVKYEKAINTINMINETKQFTYSDWRIPSLEELNIIYQNKKLFTTNNHYLHNGLYWSSEIRKLEGRSDPRRMVVDFSIYNTQGKTMDAWIDDENSFFIVRTISDLSEDKKSLIGQYTSEHPSISSVEIFAKDDILKMKVILPNLISEYKFVLQKESKLYFSSDNVWDGSSYNYYLDISNLKDIVIINSRNQKVHLTKN